MHQCVHCSKIIPVGSKELLEGCNDCGGRFFFYIKDEQMQRILEKQKNQDVEDMVKIPKEEKKQIEQDIREIVGVSDEEFPIILDIESVRVAGSGKFEIDLVKLFREGRPIIYKLEEGKYIIDIASTLQKGLEKKKRNKKKEFSFSAKNL